jgi:hypothetical protein
VRNTTIGKPAVDSCLDRAWNLIVTEA